MKGVLTYKGYNGSVNYSAEDNCLYGKILGINDVILYEGNTIAELKLDFEESVDDYLEFCAEIGKEPQKEYKGSFNVRISPELHKQAALEAMREEKSLNYIIGKAIELYLQKHTLCEN